MTTRAYLATLGYTSTVNKTTVIGTETVKNDYIKTDISGITSTVTPNVVIKASDKAYHVFAPTATSGAVTKVTKEANGSYTMTLSDGTVLKESKLTHGDKQAAINDVIAILSGRDHVTPTYYFLLDTHGHYMYLSEEYFRTVAYFTGVLKPVSDWNSWSNEVAYVAQFVDVADPTQVEEIPVTLAWANAALNRINTSTGRSDIMWYYDITDELYGDAVILRNPYSKTTTSTAPSTCTPTVLASTSMTRLGTLLMFGSATKYRALTATIPTPSCSTLPTALAAASRSRPMSVLTRS